MRIDFSAAGLSKEVWQLRELICKTSNNAYFNIRKYVAVEDATYSKGSTKYSNVTSTSSTAYPTNGRSGNYWYVSKGLQ